MTRKAELRDLASSLRGFRALAASVLVLTLAAASLEGVSLLQIVPFLRGLASSAHATELRRICWLLLALVALKSLAAFSRGVLSAKLEISLLSRARQAVLNRLFGAPYAALLSREPGDLVNLYMTQTEGYVNAVSSLLSLVNAAVSLLAYAAVLVSLSARMTLAAAALGLLALGAIRYFGRKVRERSARLVSTEEKLSRLILDDLSSLRAIQAYGIRSSRIALHARAQDDERRDYMALHAWRSGLKPLTESLGAAAILGGALALLGLRPDWLFSNAPLLLGFAFVALRMLGWAGSLSQSIFDLSEWLAPAANLLGFVDRAEPAKRRGTEAPPRRFEKIEARGVSFSYAGARSAALRSFDLQIGSGERVALVGATGCGKTTFAHLLIGLLSPSAGDIRIDSTPLEKLDAEALAGRIAIVFDDGPVFNETIAWNIGCGRELSPERIAAAARAAEIEGFIEALPEKYETRVGHRGIELSAGQRQRLAIARAVAGDPALLVLDEATGALDPETERNVLENLRADGAGRMMLLITHRRDAAAWADRVVQMELS